VLSGGGVGLLMVFGIEGRSVVGNLRIVVSWSSVLAGAVLFIICCQVESISAQETAPDQPVPPAPAANPETPAAADPPAPVVEPTPAPRPKPAAVVYAEPRATEKDDQEWRRLHQTKFQKAQKALAVNAAETKELIDTGNHFVDRMTIPKFVSDLPRLAIEPVRRFVDGTLPNPRAVLLKAITDRAAEVLAQKPPHHPDIQLGIVILLGTLNAQPAALNVPAAPYVGSYKALITVLEDSTFPLQCRIAAAAGLGRMGRESKERVALGDLSVVQRNDIATSLAKVILSTNVQGNEDGLVWFRGRLAEALGDCGEAYDLNKGSVFIDALLITATNPAENLRVRAAAIRAASQLKWDVQTNFPLILHETVKLAAEIAKGYNDSVAAKKLVPADFRHANMDVYFTFQPKTDKQANVLNWGLLNQPKRNGLAGNAPAVKAAYDIVLPVVNTILANGNKLIAIPPALMTPLQAWVAANPPQNRKPTTISPNPLP